VITHKKMRPPKVTPLTIMNDIDGSAGSENREYAGFIKADGVYGTVLDLGVGTESMNAHVYRVTGPTTYLGTVKQRTRTGGIGDVEAILGGRHPKLHGDRRGV
jgi:hypothetical protein